MPEKPGLSTGVGRAGQQVEISSKFSQSRNSITPSHATGYCQIEIRQACPPLRRRRAMEDSIGEVTL